jgi:DNA invertase Pin-like site-specific DNA recombinase
MKVFYSRVSSPDQNPARQIENRKGYDYVLIDKCSGTIPLFERPQGAQIKRLVDNKSLDTLETLSIDRLGRSTLDVLQVWSELTEKGITIICHNPNIRNIGPDGKVDKFSELMMSILSTMSKFERDLIKERQMEGIRIRKQKGLYEGRRIGSTDTIERLLNKPKTKKIIAYLKKGKYSYVEIGKIVGCSPTTITKINRVYTQLQ